MTQLGQNVDTGGTKDAVVSMTRWHLKCLQDGTLDQDTHGLSVMHL